MLISLGILTVGLLGVAALFPVGSFYMQKGEVADHGSAIAQAAFSDVMARGMLNPEEWYVMTPSSFETGQLSVDGPQTSFSRPAAAAVAEAKSRWPINGFCQQMGGVYVIDPVGAAAMTNYEVPSTFQIVARPVPASAAVANLGASYYGEQWQKWWPNWPIRRVTFRQARVTAPATATYFVKTQPFTTSVAERLFTASDDLVLDIPPQADRPAIQSWQMANLDGGSVADDPLTRLSNGNYSWLVTVVPNDIRTLAGVMCEVSVAVFYKRILPSKAPTNIDEMTEVAATERMARAKIVSAGLNGGEVLLEKINDGIDSGTFDELKTGQWILLCGPHPTSAPVSTDGQPIFVARWYRVLSIEGKNTKLDAQGLEGGTVSASDPERRLVSLRGPQWPWAPEPNGNLTANHLSNNLCVAIVPNVVAVHAKTVRLEGGSAWSVR